MTKHARPERVNHDRWLVSYADFITLLFAFFVVLYASSQADRRKAQQLSESIQVAFQDLGAVKPAGANAAFHGASAPLIAGNVQGTSEVGGSSSSDAEWKSLRDAEEAIGKALSSEIERNEVSVLLGPEGLTISLKEIGFYNSGAATVRPDSLGAISRLAAVLKERPENLRIEGHTDNVPIHNSRFASNWELSAARATEMIRLLIGRYGLDPGRLSAAGYAEFHPSAPNSSAEGRAQNRRVDIVVLAPVASLAPKNSIPQAENPVSPQPQP